ncbi:dihydroxyacetone kinase phosphoryl donor subunit DhaM [Cellulosimicrobium cellulans]|uniref:dihydroxyacetone kinase phosphoryl donor subunit DhaM n=1 Tax=Cellulosimicrobium cellulans TaxID=1710 RepID=UPI002406C03B|nr:dihydroxyacetone kinase phosphoryl donor subunit DhaM [Cellulosimicrobium cellulans]MDF9878108.1 PTS hybrid protein [Cellulosimicrobium cellulans]
MSGTVGARARVALVLVSHSQRLAEGAVELSAQMAPGVLLLAAGGTDDGGLGTSYDRVSGALEEALGVADGAVVLADLGSAVMTVESVLDMEDGYDGRVRLADAPFVEGAVAAAVTAHGGGGVSEVLASAEHAGGTFAVSAGRPEGDEPAAEAAAAADGAARAVVTLRNPLGLHARPAAVLARLVAGFDASIAIDGVNGASVLELMKLGATGGQELTVTGEGPQAADAVAAVVDAVEGGFGEV